MAGAHGLRVRPLAMESLFVHLDVAEEASLTESPEMSCRRHQKRPVLQLPHFRLGGPGGRGRLPRRVLGRQSRGGWDHEVLLLLRGVVGRGVRGEVPW